MDCFWNKIANKARRGRSACAVPAAGAMVAVVVCFVVLLHYRGYSFAALLAITVFLIRIPTVRNKAMFKRRLWLGVHSSREGDDSLSGKRHKSTMTSGVGMELRPSSVKRVHGETSYAKTTGRASPSCTTPTRGNGFFEGAITRLAGAAELGTEPLIYVRREDVTEVVDTFVRSMKTPGEMSITSPALARLAIVRRSNGEDDRGRKYVYSSGFRSARDGKRSVSADRGLSSSTFRGSRGITGGQSSPTMSPSFRGPREMKGRALFGENIEQRRRTQASGSLKYRPATPTSGAKLLDLTNATMLKGGHDDAHCLWQQIFHGASSAAAEKPVSPKTPIACAINASASGASEMTSAYLAGSKKINCVSNFSARVMGKEAAFEDFWSTGWG